MKLVRTGENKSRQEENMTDVICRPEGNLLKLETKRTKERLRKRALSSPGIKGINM